MHECKGKVIKLDFSPDELESAAEFLKMFADSTRMKMMAAMYSVEQPVCDIAKTAALSHSLTSHQLSAMKKYKLVKSVKYGKNVYYTLDDKCVYNILALAVGHVRHLQNMQEVDIKDN